jgi:hypothetical protein
MKLDSRLHVPVDSLAAKVCSILPVHQMARCPGHCGPATQIVLLTEGP